MLLNGDVWYCLEYPWEVIESLTQKILKFFGTKHSYNTNTSTNPVHMIYEGIISLTKDENSDYITCNENNHGDIYNPENKPLNHKEEPQRDQCLESVHRFNYPDGSYKISWKNGCTYEGPISNNKMNGKGIFKFTGGSIYNGFFKDGKMCGYGTLIGERFKYTGQWQDDKMNGVGKIEYGNGNVYNGKWVNSMRCGFGTLTTNYYTHTGLWDEICQMDWVSQSSIMMIKYEGNMLYGKRHGEGVFYYPDGKYYKGMFFDDNFHGTGVMYDKNGEIIYDGEYHHGKLNGFGKLRIKENFIYEGEFVDGLRHGNGTILDNEGNILLKGTFNKNHFSHGEISESHKEIAESFL